MLHPSAAAVSLFAVCCALSSSIGFVRASTCSLKAPTWTCLTVDGTDDGDLPTFTETMSDLTTRLAAVYPYTAWRGFDWSTMGAKYTARLDTAWSVKDYTAYYAVALVSFLWSKSTLL